jgi:4'-phosphopantetheinyl transferase
VAAARRPSVRLYRTDVAAFGDRDWSGLVAAEDLAALPQSVHPRRRAEHLAGRALLRVALEDWTGRPPLSHELRATENGRPECIGGPELSVAHSRGAVLCALAPAGRIGIDVELPVAGRGIHGIAERYFSLDERRWVGSRPERFYSLWVLKEAYLKALGVGLAGGLDALSCEIEPPRIEAHVCGSRAAPALALYSVADGLVGIAALASGLVDVAAFRWAPDEPLRAAPLELVARTAA